MFVVRNILTDSVVVIDENLLEVLRRMPNIPDSEIIEYHEEINECQSQGVLVPDEKDEIQAFQAAFIESRYHPEVFNPYILTTTGCNLNCRYCYEDGIFRGLTMNRATIDQVVSYCATVFQEGDYKNFWITLYGGEPLVNYQSLQRLVVAFKNQENAIGTPIHFDMVTNATLLSQEKAKWLVQHGLQRVQITFDGSPEVHDHRRHYPSGKGTFSKIIRNVIDASDVIPEIRIRCNFDSSNRESLYELIDILADHGLGSKVFIYFAPINETIPTDNPQCAAKFCSQYRLPDHEMAEALVDLCRYAKSRDFKTIDKYEVGPCMSTTENGVAIDPVGNLYKCLSFIGREDFIIGSIWKTDKSPLYQEFMDDSFLTECYHQLCPYIPVCGGGCRFEAFLALRGDFKTRFCRRDFIETVNLGLTDLHYK